MPKLLISVRSAYEAGLALAAGVDLIDVKEPAGGALGAASPQTIHEILRLIDRRAATSVAYGELLQLSQNVARQEADGGNRSPRSWPDYAKTGLADCASVDNWPDLWRQVFQPFPRHVTPVAVIYADWRQAKSPPPAEVVQQARKLTRAAILIDTFDKSGPGLLRLMSAKKVQDLIDEIHAMQIEVAVAGQLTLDDALAIAALEPDYVAARGGVCRPDRNGDIDPTSISSWRSAIASAARGKQSLRSRATNAPSA